MSPDFGVTVEKKNAARVFAISLLLTALLYAVPNGRTLAWPLVLVSTLVHELGHGLTAALLGGSFESLAVYPDASGVAAWRGSFGRVATAAVAGAGLVGPPVAAFLLIVLGRHERRARLLVGVLGAGLLAVTLLLVRNPFGFAFTSLLAAAFILVALRASRLSQTVIVAPHGAVRALGVLSERLSLYEDGDDGVGSDAVRRHRDGHRALPPVLVLGRAVRRALSRSFIPGCRRVLPTLTPQRSWLRAS